MKVVKARKDGTFIVGGATHKTLSLRERMSSFLMIHYFTEIAKAQGDSDAARDTIATVIARATGDVTKLLAAIRAAASARNAAAMRPRMNSYVVFAMAELSDLAAVFVRETSYADEYAEIAEAIKSLMVTMERFMPPDAHWEAAPAAPPLTAEEKAERALE